jgi:predicted glycosyltransferase
MRIVHYSHDTYGLGHIRRTLAIARQLSEDGPDVSQLLITGSMQAHMYQLPERLDYIKLPSINKRSSGEYCARVLALPFETALAMRENVIFEATRNFEPDLVLVDKAPAGMKGEMLGTLSYLKAKRPGTKLVLGMRDIDDDAQAVRAEWTREGVYPLLEDVYDAILLYGSREIYDPVREYGLSREIEAKIIPVGYIRKSDPIVPPEQLRRELQMRTDRLVVVTAGGGGDSFGLIQTYLEMLENLSSRGSPAFDSLIVTGPLMATAKKAMLQRYRSTGLPLTMKEFTPELFSYLNAADLVVSMGGYNSICEILSLNKRAIIVPRVKPRTEQLIRAERFAARGLFRVIHPRDLTPDHLLATVEAGLSGDRPVLPEQAGLDMNGAASAQRAIMDLLATTHVARPAWRAYSLADVA